jgi:hypothetical protein
MESLFLKETQIRVISKQVNTRYNQSDRQAVEMYRNHHRPCRILFIFQIFGILLLAFYFVVTFHLIRKSHDTGADSPTAVIIRQEQIQQEEITTMQNQVIHKQKRIDNQIIQEQKHNQYVIPPHNNHHLTTNNSSIIQQRQPQYEIISTLLEEEDDDTHNFLPRILAFVFPQFHRDALNDHLWGENFTDWDNLRKAPFKNRLGYPIPRPTELGYYDYTQVQPRKKQGELALEYGIDGFVYHHYWFYDENHPGPNLHLPLLEMLRDGHPNVPFALHWCAAKWVNTWNGPRVMRSDFVFREKGVLQKQYFPENDEEGKITEHYNWLRQFFHHGNYIKVDGKPLFMMYQKKPGSFPVLKRLKELAIQDGFPGIYYTVGLTKPHEHLLDIGDLSRWKVKPQKASVALSKYEFDKVVSYPNPTEWNENRSLEIPDWCLDGGGIRKKRPRDIAGIISSFDNTPRRQYDEANIWSSDPPEVVIDRFRKSLHSAIYYESCCFPVEKQMRESKRKRDDDRFVLINAMNEWAEGMALEPSDVYGRRFLEVIRDVKQQILTNQCKM